MFKLLFRLLFWIAYNHRTEFHDSKWWMDYIFEKGKWAIVCTVFTDDQSCSIAFGYGSKCFIYLYDEHGRVLDVDLFGYQVRKEQSWA